MQTSEATTFLSMVMMMIGVVPAMLIYLDHGRPQKKVLYAGLWLVMWWAVPTFRMVRFLLTN